MDFTSISSAGGNGHTATPTNGDGVISRSSSISDTPPGPEGCAYYALEIEESTRYIDSAQTKLLQSHIDRVLELVDKVSEDVFEWVVPVWIKEAAQPAAAPTAAVGPHDFANNDEEIERRRRAVADVWAGIAAANGLSASVGTILKVFVALGQSDDALHRKVAQTLQAILLPLPLDGRDRKLLMGQVAGAIDAYVLAYLSCLRHEMSVGPNKLKASSQRHVTYLLDMLVNVQGIEAIPALRAVATHDLIDWTQYGDWGAILMEFGLPADLTVDAKLVRRTSLLHLSRHQRDHIDCCASGVMRPMGLEVKLLYWGRNDPKCQSRSCDFLSPDDGALEIRCGKCGAGWCCQTCYIDSFDDHCSGACDAFCAQLDGANRRHIMRVSEGANDGDIEAAFTSLSGVPCAVTPCSDCGRNTGCAGGAGTDGAPLLCSLCEAAHGLVQGYRAARGAASTSAASPLP